MGGIALDMVSAKKHFSSIWIFVLLLVVFGLVGKSQGQNLRGQTGLLNADGKINLRILCTTGPTEGRTDDFVKFLSEHFVKVDTTDYESFRSNRAVETLDKLIELLGDEAHAETAKRLLARYTAESFDSPPQWRQWFEENKDRLYFSDVGGYKFFIVPAGYPVGRKNQTAIGKTLYR